MTKILNNKPVYDLEEITFQFAKAVRIFVKTLPKAIANIEDGKQLVKSSGSVGANYREANESLSKKDFLRVHQCLIFVIYLEFGACNLGFNRFRHL